MASKDWWQWGHSEVPAGIALPQCGHSTSVPRECDKIAAPSAIASIGFSEERILSFPYLSQSIFLTRGMHEEPPTKRILSIVSIG